MTEATKTWKEWAADASVDFWDARSDRETLSHESLEEAVEYYLDDVLNRPVGVEADLREMFPEGFTVYGFRRKEVTQQWRARVAESMAERFAEEFEDEYGGGDYEAAFDENAQDDLEAELLLLVEKLKLSPWQCEQEVKTTIPIDELITALREWCPHWFEKA